MQKVPLNALNLDFCSCGFSNNFRDNWLHVKTAPYTIIAQVINGSYEVSCNNQTIIANEGEAFLVPANTTMKILHHFGTEPNKLYFASQWIHFHYTVFDSIDITSLFNLPLKIDKKYEKQLDSSIKRGLKLEEENSLNSTIIKNKIALEVLEIILEISEPNPIKMQQFKTSTRFIPVFNFIKNNLHQPITVNEMAKRASMSLAHFHHVFKASVGCSPMNYLKKVRLEKASNLLLKSELSLAEIAELTGFSNQFHFCREFKNKTDLPPSVYRKQNRWS